MRITPCLFASRSLLIFHNDWQTDKIFSGLTSPLQTQIGHIRTLSIVLELAMEAHVGEYIS